MKYRTVNKPISSNMLVDKQFKLRLIPHSFNAVHHKISAHHHKSLTDRNQMNSIKFSNMPLIAPLESAHYFII